MAIILSFVPRKRFASRPAAAGPASILFFPGIRYERPGGAEGNGEAPRDNKVRTKPPSKPSPALA